MSKNAFFFMMLGLAALVMFLLGLGDGASAQAIIWEELVTSIEDMPRLLACRSSFEGGLAGACSAGVP